MHREAAALLGLDLNRSYFVGDRVRDVLPAQELGGRGILVRTGYGAREEGEAEDWVQVVDDLPAAARRILAQAR
jgi:phosphoglycolate phosphatase-like HAD superfamily hydrolase